MNNGHSLLHPGLVESGKNKSRDEAVHAQDLVYLQHRHECAAPLLEDVPAAPDAGLARREGRGDGRVPQADEIELVVGLGERLQRLLDAFGPRLATCTAALGGFLTLRILPLLVLLALRPDRVERLVGHPLLLLHVRHAYDGNSNVGLLERSD